MLSRLRPILAILLVLAGLGLVACGGGERGPEATASTDVDELLEDTFANDADVESGRFGLALRIDPQGAATRELGGPVSLKVGGPFESVERTLPKFDLDLAFDGAGESVAAGATSTGETGYVRFQGTDYVLSDLMFAQLKAGYEEQGKRSGDEQQLMRLGIDPRRWLTDPRNAGEAKVGDEETIKITGGVDVPRMLDDVDAAMRKAGQLGLPGRHPMPSRLSAADKREIAAAVEDVEVEIHTGRADRILRRMAVALDVRDPDDPASGSAAVKFAVSMTELGEDQTIEAPSGAKPFEQLAPKLRGLGGGGAPPGGGSAASRAELQEYVDCVQRAGADRAAARRCADRLKTP